MTALLLLSTLLASSDVDARRRRRRRRQTKVQKAAAKAFAQGQRHFKERDYLGALEAFEQAYKLRPHYLMQCNIARCHERLVDMILAAKHYRRCLEEGGRRRRRFRTRVRRALAAVRRRITQVSVRAPGGGVIYVDGKRVGEAPGRVALNPGRRTIEVRRRGARPASSTITTRGGEMRTLVLRPTALERQRIPQRPRRKRYDDEGTRGSGALGQGWFWTAAALTGGLLAAATVMGLRALAAKRDYEDKPSRGGYTEAQDRRLVANLLWGAALAAAAGTTTLFFFTDFGGSETRRERDMVFGIGLRGSF